MSTPVSLNMGGMASVKPFEIVRAQGSPGSNTPPTSVAMRAGKTGGLHSAAFLRPDVLEYAAPERRYSCSAVRVRLHPTRFY